jgi:hypothetical protein
VPAGATAGENDAWLVHAVNNAAPAMKTALLVTSIPSILALAVSMRKVPYCQFSPDLAERTLGVTFWSPNCHEIFPTTQ